VVSSVHAFAQSSIGTWFLVFLALTFAVCMYFFVAHRDHLKSEHKLESLLSRESSFLFNNLVLLVSCFAVLWGTLFPILSEWVQGTKVTVGPPFFNRVNIPIGLFLVLLTGVAVASLASALTPLLMFTAQVDLQRILYWLMGSLAARRWDHVHMVWPYALAGMALLQFYARDLNLILQGEESARYLGVEVERVKRVLLVVSALLTAAAVAVSGVIGFVGLIVPHVMRLIVGPDHCRLFPASMLGGAILLVGADLVARLLIAPAELPIGVVTSLLGCPFFLYLLGRRREILTF